MRTDSEDVELMKIDDESRNMLGSGFLLVNPHDSCEIDVEDKKMGRSYVMAIPLRSSRDIETRLSLKVFCAVKVESTNNSTKLARVYNKQIIVPKFAMVVFAKTKELVVGRNNYSERSTLANNIKLDFSLEAEYQVTQVSTKFNKWL